MSLPGAGYRVVIPARYASTRLPGKPLLPLAGRPLLAHVFDRACESGAAEVVVATDDERIRAAAEGFGARVCLTASAHPSGTDRLAEVVDQLGWPDDALVVNLQGDEPLLDPALLDAVAADLAAQPEAAMATLATPLTDPAQVMDPNLVKVVTDAAGFALYFSRAAIPWHRDHYRPGEPPPAAGLAGLQRHIGLYAYRAGLLRDFVRWPPAPLEQIEKLEQLRVLWQGRRVHVLPVAEMPDAGVDTPADLERVARLLAAQSPVG